MTNPYLKILLQYQQQFSPVVPFNPASDRIIRLDFTAGNQTLTREIAEDITSFEGYINSTLRDAGALYGIGGYAEHRTMYSRSGLFDAADGTEPRRLHLGTDIWGKAGTAVMAPLKGTVHSFADNKQAGDYGATIILQHELEGIIFYSLYGHLSLSSIHKLEQGRQIHAGQEFAAFGTHQENGFWPPHLHFQLVIDLQGRKGDYPGVCKYSQKESWLRNSPDADLVLSLNKFAITM